MFALPPRRKSARTISRGFGLMTQNEFSLPGDELQPGESLNATGMFRRAFEAIAADSAQATADASAPGWPGGETGPARVEEGDASAAPGLSSRDPGEFTRLFQVAQPASSEPESPNPVQTPAPGCPRSGSRTEVPAAEPGEFTRIFLGPPGGSGAESVQKPGTDAGNPIRPRGFSSPGASESAAGEGSVTHFLRGPSAVSPLRRPPAAAPVESARMSFASAAQPLSQAPSKDEELLQGGGTPARTTPSITHLLESLSAHGASEPPAFGPVVPPIPPPTTPRAEPGGVTQFIRKLTDEPPGSAAVPPVPMPPPEESGPGEYTRVVARAEEKAVGLPPLGSPVSPPPPAARPAAPAMPALPALPAMPAVTIPAVARPGVPPVTGALSPGKTKLEAMAPVLLALNTVLLMAVLLLLILLLRAR